MLLCVMYYRGGDGDENDHAVHEEFKSIGLACAEIVKQDFS